jgi:hypothetical protein
MLEGYFYISERLFGRLTKCDTSYLSAPTGVQPPRPTSPHLVITSTQPHGLIGARARFAVLVTRSLALIPPRFLSLSLSLCCMLPFVSQSSMSGPLDLTAKPSICIARNPMPNGGHRVSLSPTRPIGISLMLSPQGRHQPARLRRAVRCHRRPSQLLYYTPSPTRR